MERPRRVTAFFRVLRFGFSLALRSDLDGAQGSRWRGGCLAAFTGGQAKSNGGEQHQEDQNLVLFERLHLPVVPTRPSDTQAAKYDAEAIFLSGRVKYLVLKTFGRKRLARQYSLRM